MVFTRKLMGGGAHYTPRMFRAKFRETYNSKQDCQQLVEDAVATVDGLTLDEVNHTNRSAAGTSRAGHITVDFTVSGQLNDSEIQDKLTSELRGYGGNRNVYKL